MKKMAFLMMKRILFLMFFKFIDENKYFHQRHCINLIFNQSHGIILMKIFVFINEIEKHKK